MKLKQRIEKIEAVIYAKKFKGAAHGITLDEWRRLADGEDILPVIPERNRAAFLEWQKRADARRQQAAETILLFE